MSTYYLEILHQAEYTMSKPAAVTMLNRAFAADPDAIHAMICNRVPCNEALADDPTVVVQESLVSNGGWTVSTLGLLNGLLGEMGLPAVAVMFSEEPEPDGRHKMLGFCEYKPKETST